jgi:F-type H+-transporting ATPase subunit gamma
MPFLVEIKKKISAVQNTRKITKAMELVAASRMKQFQRKAMGTRMYAWSLLDGLTQAHATMDELDWGKKRTGLPVLFVLMTSDKGLCGSLNQQLIRTLWRSQRWKQLPPEERRLITIGRKSTEAANYAGVAPLHSFEGVKEQLDPSTALAIVDQIVGYWDRGECREIQIVSPHYVNPFVFHPTIKKLLPFTQAMVGTHLGWRNPEGMEASVSQEEREQGGTESYADEPTYLEPSRERVVEALAHQLIQSIFLQSFYELKATEYSSRMVAMKNATEAAGEMVRSLTLSYNKARQGAITQQLAELTGGSLAVE